MSPPKPSAKNPDVHWEFVENEKSELKACLPLGDVLKLKEILIRCESK